MKKALLIAPMSSVHERFNSANIFALRELGFDVSVAANFETDEHSREYRKSMSKAGFETYNLPFVRASLLKNVKCVSKLRSVLKDNCFDLIHCHTETGGIVTRLAALGSHNCTFVYTPHGMSFYEGSSLKSRLVYKPIERFICSGMDLNIALNSEELKVLNSWNKAKAGFTHGIGVDFSALTDEKIDKTQIHKEFGIDHQKKILLSIGELNENKNHIAVLKALSLIPEEKRPHYIICGEGRLMDCLSEQKKLLGLSENVTLTGYRYDIIKFLKSADIFAFTSFHEGLSVALMQAMACKLPVVCSDIRGNVDLIENNKGGFLVNPTDYEKIADSVLALINDENMRNEFGSFNSEKVKECSIENVQKELKEIYYRVTGR